MDDFIKHLDAIRAAIASAKDAVRGIDGGELNSDADATIRKFMEELDYELVELEWAYDDVADPPPDGETTARSYARSFSSSTGTGIGRSRTKD